MTDPHIFDRTPSRDFADRLEAEFLRAATGVPTIPRDPRPEETTVTVRLDDPPIDHRPRPSWRWPAVAAAAALLIVALVAVLTRDSGDDTPPVSTSSVSFTVMWEYSENRHECTPSLECINRFDLPATATFTGDVAGTGYQAVYWNEPVVDEVRDVVHAEHVVMYQVRGSVAGCGSGLFTIAEITQFESGPGQDFDTGTYTGTWQIVPESGRGPLAALGGNGTTVAGFLAAQESGRTFTGTVTCDTAG